MNLPQAITYYLAIHNTLLSLNLPTCLYHTTGMQVLEWNGVPLMGKTYEEVQCIMGQPCAEAELCVRL